VSDLVNLVGVGQVGRVDDSQEVQLLQVVERAKGQGFVDRILERITRVAEFGFASVPPIGAEILLLRRGGDRSQSLAIGSSHRPSRPRDLKPGDSGIYDVRGAKVMLTSEGLVIDCAGLPAVIKNSPKLRVEVDVLEVTGDIVSRADGAPVSLNGLHDAYAQHKHTGVETGPGISGPTDTPA
jgi:phage baseplate assembly protein V